MSPRQPLRDETISYDSPNWKPLLTFAPEHVPDFMWMEAVELEDGTRLHAYKHYWTRRYLHLAEGGKAFIFDWEGCYREVDPLPLLEAVLCWDREDGPSMDPVRRSLWHGHVKLSWAPSARRHRVSRERAAHAIKRGAAGFFVAEPEDGAPAEESIRVLFLGEDPDGVPLEVVAVKLDRNASAEAEEEWEYEPELRVVHKAVLRETYRVRYEEAKSWRR